ncbi:MAG: hypothetical protein IT389_01185 [Nitrospira sp.]|nr:hypothetical protein [Nitrospira sp.]
MTGWLKRRQLFVHPVQYSFVAMTLLYFSCLAVVLYEAVLLPIAQPLDDPSLSWQERARVATEFLDVTARVWPWLLITFLGLLLHSLYFMHRIAGPLYRFNVLFHSVGTGQIYQRARLREHDYLHPEARGFNVMMDSLEQKIETLQLHCEIVSQAYEDVAAQLDRHASHDLTDALRTLEARILGLKTSLTEFQHQPAPPPPDQQRIDFSDPRTMNASFSKKAA